MIFDNDKEDRRSRIELNHPRKLFSGEWKENWQLKIISFVLALALWFYLYRK